MTTRIIVVPHDEPLLSNGDNYIAYYEDSEPGDVLCGGGNTAADAVDDLISRAAARRVKAALMAKFDGAIAALRTAAE